MRVNDLPRMCNALLESRQMPVELESGQRWNKRLMGLVGHPSPFGRVRCLMLKEDIPLPIRNG